MRRRVLVLDAADHETESTFWAALLGGTVHRDGAWHSVVVDGEWALGVQHAPDHVPPVWPTVDGAQQQQLHLDLHVDDLAAAMLAAAEAGARQLQGARAPADNPEGDEKFAVFASPAGHPFCLGAHG